MNVQLAPLFGCIPEGTKDLRTASQNSAVVEILNDCVVWPDSGLVRTRDGRMRFDLIWGEENLGYCGQYDSWRNWFPRRITGPCVNVSLLWWQNYYHWICDVLPRLQNKLWDDDVRFLLPRSLSEWQIDTLRIIGLQPSRFEYCDARRPVRVEELLHLGPVIMTGNTESASICSVRDSIVTSLHPKADESGSRRRIYISRKNAAHRRIVNEQELIALLTLLDFEVIQTERLSFREQVAVFSQAEIIVGAHGAGFTNMLWSPRNTACFEIFEPDSVRICYWSLSAALGHRYFCAVGEVSPQLGAENNLFVDPKSFRTALDHVITGK
jgi:capsular polysaccharide biosynthesis protein